MRGGGMHKGVPGEFGGEKCTDQKNEEALPPLQTMVHGLEQLRKRSGWFEGRNGRHTIKTGHRLIFSIAGKNKMDFK